MRPSQGFGGTGTNGHLIQEKQGNNGQILREQGNKDNIGEQGTEENIFFLLLGYRGSSQFILGEQGNRYPPPPRYPTPSPLEGINNMIYFWRTGQQRPNFEGNGNKDNNGVQLT